MEIKRNNKNKSKFNPKISDIFTKLNINNFQRNIINKYEKEKDRTIKRNYIIRNVKPIETNKSINIIPNYSTNLYFYRNKNNFINNNKDNTHKYTICNYTKLSPDYSMNNTSSNNYLNYTQKKCKNYERKYPVIMVSDKRNKKMKNNRYINIINNKREKIIKIQSIWRGYFLRKIAIGSIKKYVGFVALIKYMNKIYIKKMKILFLLKMKKNKDFIYTKNYDNKNKTINVMNGYKNNKKLFSRIIKMNNINNRYDRYEKKNYINKSNSNEKFNSNISSINYTNNELQKSVYIPKKVSIYTFEKNKILFKNNMNMKIKIKKLIKHINKICYYKHYPIILYRLKIKQKMNLIHEKLQKLKNIINLIEKNKIKQIFKKYRDYILNQKVKEEIFKTKDIIKKNIDNTKEIKNNKAIHSFLKTFIERKIDEKNKFNIHIIKKYFKLWNKQIDKNNNINIIKENENILASNDKSKKKHIKIKYSNNISFRTESSLISEKKESLNSNNLSTSCKKRMKVKSIVIRKGSALNLFSSDFNLENKNSKLLNIIKKRNKKNILNKFFILWKKIKND